MCGTERAVCEVYFYASSSLQKDREEQKKTKQSAGNNWDRKQRGKGERAEKKENKNAKNIHLHL